MLREWPADYFACRSLYFCNDSFFVIYIHKPCVSHFSSMEAHSRDTYYSHTHTHFLLSHSVFFVIIHTHPVCLTLYFCNHTNKAPVPAVAMRSSLRRVQSPIPISTCCKPSRPLFFQIKNIAFVVSKPNRADDKWTHRQTDRQTHTHTHTHTNTNTHTNTHTHRF
jgi:hypothetical protein